MWPWEHLAVGYLLYSGYLHVRRSESPGHLAALLLAGATQFPDIVDKPLAWTFGVVADGTAVAHSAVVAGPLVVGALLLDRRGVYGAAIAIGYVSHLLGDMLYPVLTGAGGPAVSVVLWPFVTSGGSTPGFGAEFARLFLTFLHFLQTPLGLGYLLGELVLLGTALTVWVWDGSPGLRTVLDSLGRRPSES